MLKPRLRQVPALWLSIGCIAASTLSAQAAQSPGAVALDGDDIGGVVTGARGPEAGVWVITETDDLPTKFTRIVVTDDRGRYVVPDLPKANYSVWVRGYGLADSPKVIAAPGSTVDLKVTAADAAAAAQYYPAVYWYSMLKIPAKAEFPLGEAKDQGQWLDVVKTDGCITCHQIGNKATRTIPDAFKTVGSSKDAWERRIMSGQAGMNMAGSIGRLDTSKALGLFADWTDRIAAGELPKARPERPQGVERNVVVTLWDWSSPTAYLHDEIATDKRNPTVNGYGLIYGAPELSTDMIPVLDPVKNVATTIKAPVRDDNTPSAKDDPVVAPSAYWGEEPIWDSRANLHNPMFDGEGRVWFTHRIRGPENPAFCKQGSDHPSARLFPVERTGRQLSVYDSKTGKFTLVDTCFGTHHLQFAHDANNTLWTSGGGQVIGWLNSKMFLATGDAAKSQGWTALIVDTNGNGKRDAYVEPNQPVDPAKDKRVVAGYYGVAPNPADGSIWGSSVGYPGYIVRLDPGANPPATALTEVYAPPAPGYSPRGMDIDRNGVVWASLASGHFASFDRRKCKGPLNGPQAATGRLCPEGWTLYPFPGPQFAGVTESGSAESSYYSWVDQWNTLGLGENVAIATGNLSDSLIVMQNGKPIQLRVPYPLGFYAKGLDGRIDDPKAGWKGRGLWTTTGNRTPFHGEGGKGARPKVAHFQVRPDPLAH